jgi:hypothetical protein
VDASLVSFEALTEVRKQCVASFLKSEFHNIPTTRLMREGDPARAIIEYAEDEKVDLIMMPTHGYGPFRRFLLGSVTAKVLHDVKCAVWTSEELAARTVGGRFRARQWSHTQTRARSSRRGAARDRH